MHGERVLLIVGGGIAAYKACELVRLIRKAGGSVTCVLTEGGAHFVTPMTLAALSENQVHTTLWDLKDEAEMGHIQLSRQADLVVVCPATADLLARMAAGGADDLATTLLLATDKPVLAAPAMNVRMWRHAATVRNIARLRADGVTILEPDEGEMSCGEFGPGRLPEPARILAAVEEALAPADLRLAGRHAIVTAGPVALPPPTGVARVDVEPALEMQAAVRAALPADVAVMAAAVSDWRVGEKAPSKLKKTADAPRNLSLVENPDILADLTASPHRPLLVVGFAAETERVIENAAAKRARKGCDTIVANDVSRDVFSGDHNQVHLVTGDGIESWERLTKVQVAEQLADRIAEALNGTA